MPSRLRRLVPALALSLAALVVPAPAGAAPGHGPDPYFPWDGNAGYDVEHYDIDVSYDFAARRLQGRTTITLTPDAELSRFSVDLLLHARRVRVDGADADFARAPNRHELRIEPATPLAAGEPVQVTIAYGGRPGEVSWRGESNWLANDHEVVTMNQPHMAPWWFPANDHPSDLATFDVNVTVPRSARVVSNGELVGRELRGRRATTHWRMTEPMATYLAYFAAGDFAVERSVTGGIASYNAVSKRLPRRERQRAMRVLGRTGEITAWLEDELGPYPFTDAGGTGGLVTRLPVGFALENQTRPTYGSWIYRSVVVHEIAHQWFGDSVAVARWRDIWLNEGFATYLEARYDEHRGRDTTDRWLRRNYRSYGPAHPFWKLSIADPGPDRIFDEAVYVRGGMALAALRTVIGDQDFADLLQQWAAENRGGNVTSEEFEAKAEQVSGQDLDAFFEAWLRAGERPAEEPGLGL